jgi:ABC-type nitrate/sulfonate/bicarbonate transport system substrate-binding protein
LAAIALAADVKDDIEDFIEDIGRAIEEISENPDAALDEISREFDRETEQLIEDAECWFADRNGGDGQCEKRDREQREMECWNTEGMTWDWDARECITREEQTQRNIDQCVND